MEPEGSLPFSQELGPILSQINPVHISLMFILILYTHQCFGLPSGIFPSGFPTKIIYMDYSNNINNITLYRSINLCR
jgi:hypothetical protein